MIAVRCAQGQAQRYTSGSARSLFLKPLEPSALIVLRNVVMGEQIVLASLLDRVQKPLSPNETPKPILLLLDLHLTTSLALRICGTLKVAS